MPFGTDTYAEGELLTTREAAKVAHVSAITIRRAVEAGKITPLRTPGGHFRFRRSDLEALLTSERSA